MYVCLCRGLTASMVRELGRKGIISPDDLIARLRLNDEDACGYCSRHIEELVEIAEDGRSNGAEERTAERGEGARHGS